MRLRSNFETGPQSAHWPANLPHVIDVPDENAVENLLRRARRRPISAAMYYYGRCYTYADTLAAVEALAGYLQQQGVARGDRVIVDLQNSPQFVVAFHAILRADAVVVPVNPMSTTDEIDYLAGDSGARVAIIGDEVLERFTPLLRKRFDLLAVARYADALGDTTTDALPEVMRRPPVARPEQSCVDFRDAVAVGCKPRPMSTKGDDIAVLPYSSGTTGRPKACVHLHSAVTFTAAAQATWYGLDESSVMTSFMPMFHVAGMQASMSAGLWAGAALVIMTRWDRDAIPMLFQRHRVTWWSAAPTMIVDVLASDRFAADTFATLKVLTGGGAAMPAAVAEQLQSRYGLRFCEGYGLTETISATHINPLQRPKPQCLGIPIFNTRSVVVDPESLAEVPQGTIGELLIAGPQVMRGYWGRPEATAETLLARDGTYFLRTGDLAYVDDEGYYFIVDRLKRMINVSGYKVWPAEVEALLYRHPAVRECCVISVPDSYRGETVKALVALKEQSRQQVTTDDIIVFARTLMASYKVPRIIEFVDALPRSGSNKIDWRKLQDLEWARTG